MLYNMNPETEEYPIDEVTFEQSINIVILAQVPPNLTSGE